MTDRPLRLGFALPGFHRVERGAEVALLSVADQLARRGHAVTVFGMGEPRDGVAYRFRHVPAIARERFERAPFFPPLRSEVHWEDMTFAAALLGTYSPSEFDAVVTCSFPFTHMALRRPVFGAFKPRQIFVTQNGDWPARANRSEYRFFHCDGLVCINPDYFADNRDRWPCALIPNGADLARFTPGQGDRARFGLPHDRPVVLMASALIESKRVLDGIRAVARQEHAHLVVAGDGPLRNEAEALAQQVLPGRYSRLSLSPADMPDLYRSADVLLHMSMTEPFGNVFVEAMGCGLPVVGHDNPRLRWIVGEGVFACDTEQPDQLDRSLAGAINRGVGFVPGEIKRFSWSAIAQQYEEFLRACCARS